MAAEPRRAAASFRRAVWHPQQRLWNAALVSAVEARFARVPALAAILVRLVVLVDSLMLLAGVLRRRMRLLGLRLGPMPRGRAAVLYVDCGVHDDGHELRLIRRWLARRRDVHIIAFEAGSEQFAAAAEVLADVPSLDLRHRCLVGPDHTSPTVTLYGSRSDGGYADSIFARDGADHEDVPAGRLSEVLLSEHGSHQGPVILRMNIEGAELAVVEDLVAAGLHQRIDGYYGMWDDLSKIDAHLDARLRRLLQACAISPLTFNGRDLGYGLRRLAIRTDVETSIRHGELLGPRPMADARALHDG
jgi:FkbM family methyltransferase